LQFYTWQLIVKLSLAVFALYVCNKLQIIFYLTIITKDAEVIKLSKHCRLIKISESTERKSFYRIKVDAKLEGATINFILKSRNNKNIKNLDIFNS